MHDSGVWLRKSRRLRQRRSGLGLGSNDRISATLTRSLLTLTLYLHLGLLLVPHLYCGHHQIRLLQAAAEAGEPVQHVQPAEGMMAPLPIPLGTLLNQAQTVPLPLSPALGTVAAEPGLVSPMRWGHGDRAGREMSLLRCHACIPQSGWSTYHILHPTVQLRVTEVAYVRTPVVRWLPWASTLHSAS